MPQNKIPESPIPGHEKHEKERQLSTIESLPVELIEKIFLHSLNVNLALASPYLASALSSERIYRLLILLAFWEDSKSDFRSPWPSRTSLDHKWPESVEEKLLDYDELAKGTYCRYSFHVSFRRSPFEIQS